ncbi:hypothetical protein PLICRDRAFT_176032 [Plicaturopsis crispa FD-325 SS-3]|nr:hypothetical protein PLICRDRAFT_176032 [Plicaturopsis crispa FD-325 SS-3]
MLSEILSFPVFEWLRQNFPSKAEWSTDDMPDLNGKVVIALLEHNAKVYIAGRSQTKVDAAIEDLAATTGKRALPLKLDLADSKSVKAAADDFICKEKELHILFNNAGVMKPPIDQTTADGYDLQFGTSVLGHFYFTKLLLPILTSTAANSPEKSVRVVNLSSILHYLYPLDFDTFKDGPKRRKRSGDALYCQSKYGVLLYAEELAKRYGDQGIISTAVNPGNIRTDLMRHLTRVEDLLLSIILFPLQYGGITPLWAATSPAGASLNGKYLIPWAREGKPRSHDPRLSSDLWEWLEDQVRGV